MKSSSQQQLDPNECGVVLLRHNVKPLNVSQRFGPPRMYIWHLHALPYTYIAYTRLEIGIIMR